MAWHKYNAILTQITMQSWSLPGIPSTNRFSFVRRESKEGNRSGEKQCDLGLSSIWMYIDDDEISIRVPYIFRSFLPQHAKIRQRILSILPRSLLDFAFRDAARILILTNRDCIINNYSLTARQLICQNEHANPC